VEAHERQAAHSPRTAMLLMNRVALLFLMPSSLLADGIAHSGEQCHIPCAMDGISGTCHTSHCGTGNVGCCKRGLVQPPCDGTIGCPTHQCCSLVSASQAAAPPPAILLSALPPMSSRVSEPKVLEEDEDRTAAASWNDEHHCAQARLEYQQQAGAAIRDGFKTSSASVGIAPWYEGLRVVLLFNSHGGYVEVMDIEGASLLQREQVGSWLRLSFVLDDEPALDCSTEACFTFDTVGELSVPESMACNLPDELVDPPPSPPPRYISRGELFAAGQLALSPPPPPPRPPLLSTDVTDALRTTPLSSRFDSLTMADDADAFSGFAASGGPSREALFGAHPRATPSPLSAASSASEVDSGVGSAGASMDHQAVSAANTGQPLQPAGKPAGELPGAEPSSVRSSASSPQLGIGMLLASLLSLVGMVVAGGWVVLRYYSPSAAKYAATLARNVVSHAPSWLSARYHGVPPSDEDTGSPLIHTPDHECDSHGRSPSSLPTRELGMRMGEEEQQEGEEEEGEGLVSMAHSRQGSRQRALGAVALDLDHPDQQGLNSAAHAPTLGPTFGLHKRPADEAAGGMHLDQDDGEGEVC